MSEDTMSTLITMREPRRASDDRPDMPAAPAAATAPAVAAAEIAPRGPFIPLLLGLAALLVVLLHQVWQLEQERQQLAASLQAAGPQLAAAQQLRQSLDRLAADTQRLADGGNAPARVLVEELRRRGITINASASPAAAGTVQPDDAGKR